MSDSAQLLDRFGLIPEADLAALLGIGIRTLRNRGSDLPAYVKTKQGRLYREESVREYLEKKTRGQS